jgi:hypothetical protein
MEWPWHHVDLSMVPDINDWGIKSNDLAYNPGTHQLSSMANEDIPPASESHDLPRNEDMQYLHSQSHLNFFERPLWSHLDLPVQEFGQSTPQITQSGISQATAIGNASTENYCTSATSSFNSPDAKVSPPTKRPINRPKDGSVASHDSPRRKKQT